MAHTEGASLEIPSETRSYPVGGRTTSMTTVLEGISGLAGAIGRHLGYSEWHTVTQEQISAFADATGDHQWIHTDPVRAKSGPFGTTIAHGYLPLSLLPSLLPEVLVVKGIAMGVNYGANRVRFPSPVPSGSKVRLGATISQVDEIAGGARVQIDVTIEVDGATKPSLVAQALFNYYV